MTFPENKLQPVWWRDAQFWFAMCLGPIAWLLYSNLWNEPVDLSKSFENIERYLILVLLYPLFEEIVFRGLIQGYLRNTRIGMQERWGLSVANILTSVLFSLVHLVNQSLLLSVLVFFPSLVFGFARDRYRTIVPSIALHVFYNFGAIGLFSR